MSPLDYVYLAIIIVCLLLSASFSASDMVYSCVSQSRLEKDKSKASKKALKLAENYDNTIATILFGNDFVNVLASSLTALPACRVFSSRSPFFEEQEKSAAQRRSAAGRLVILRCTL